MNTANDRRSIPNIGRCGYGRNIVSASALLALLVVGAMALLPAQASAAAGSGGQVSVGISVRFGPPPLPYYAQPICPGPGYLWTPGYWAWDPVNGYYWVPGTWVMAPFPGALWTPGYWGWEPARAVFIWHAGYWGPRVGFYGGINYGFGYPGTGFYGGYWRGNSYFYNRSVTRINVVNVTNVYEQRVNVREVSRVSYNGGEGGIAARPSRDDMMAERDRRMGPIGTQTQHRQMAQRMPEMRWSQNHGRPDIAATARPRDFSGRDVERASRPGGEYHQPQMGRQGAAENPGFRRFGNQPNQRPQRGYQNQPNRNREQMQQPRPQPQYRNDQGRPNQGRPNYNRQNQMQRQGGQRQGAQGRRGNQERQRPKKEDKGKPGIPHRY